MMNNQQEKFSKGIIVALFSGVLLSAGILLANTNMAFAQIVQSNTVGQSSGSSQTGSGPGGVQTSITGNQVNQQAANPAPDGGLYTQSAAGTQSAFNTQTQTATTNFGQFALAGNTMNNINTQTNAQNAVDNVNQTLSLAQIAGTTQTATASTGSPSVLYEQQSAQTNNATNYVAGRDNNANQLITNGFGGGQQNGNNQTQSALAYQTVTASTNPLQSATGSNLALNSITGANNGLNAANNNPAIQTINAQQYLTTDQNQQSSQNSNQTAGISNTLQNLITGSQNAGPVQTASGPQNIAANQAMNSVQDSSQLQALNNVGVNLISGNANVNPVQTVSSTQNITANQAMSSVQNGNQEKYFIQVAANQLSGSGNSGVNQTISAPQLDFNSQTATASQNTFQGIGTALTPGFNSYLNSIAASGLVNPAQSHTGAGQLANVTQVLAASIGGSQFSFPTNNAQNIIP